MINNHHLRFSVIDSPNEAPAPRWTLFWALIGDQFTSLNFQFSARGEEIRYWPRIRTRTDPALELGARLCGLRGCPSLCTHTHTNAHTLPWPVGQSRPVPASQLQTRKPLSPLSSSHTLISQSLVIYRGSAPAAGSDRRVAAAVVQHVWG